MLFWSTFALLIASLLIGLSATMKLYDRLDGDADLDRIVRESC